MIDLNLNIQFDYLIEVCNKLETVFLFIDFTFLDIYNNWYQPIFCF